MTDRQYAALFFHCRLAQETANPRFGAISGAYSSILTVNSGYE